MKYVVIGVDGQLSRRIAQNMVNSISGNELIFTCNDLQRLSDKLKEGWSNKNVTVRQVDYSNIDEITSAFSGAERLFMASEVKNKVEKQQYYNIIEAAKKAGIKHIIYGSFLKAGKEDDSIVNYLKRSGLDYNIMHSNLYMDNYLTYFPKIAFLYNRKWRTNAGEGKATFVAIDDCAKVGTALLLGKGENNREYNVTGSQLLSERDICQLVSYTSKVKLEYTPLSNKELLDFFNYIHIPRSNEKDNPNALLPWYSDDIVSLETSIGEGIMAVESNTIRQLTRQEPLKIEDIIGIYSPAWPEQAEQGYKREKDAKLRRKKYWYWVRNK